MDRNTDRNYSLQVALVLDAIGYNSRQIEFRRDFIADIVSQANRNEHVRFFVCGSVAEGIVPLDQQGHHQGKGHRKRALDVYGVVKEVTCADDSAQFRGISGISLFQVERGLNVTPGYAMIKLVRLDKHFFEARFASSLVPFEGCHFLSSQRILFSNRTDRANLCLKTESYGLSDRVVSLQCFCPSVLEKFSTRRRANWPPCDVVKRISASEAILIPLSSKESTNSSLEWRVSFTKAEKLLVASLPPVSVKSHVILRMLFNEGTRLKTFFLKNALFWVTEQTPEHLLQEDILVKQVISVLRFLKRCLLCSYMPNYFNPSWNILQESSATIVHDQVAYIDELLQLGDIVFLRSPVIARTCVRLYRSIASRRIEKQSERHERQDTSPYISSIPLK